MNFVQLHDIFVGFLKSMDIITSLRHENVMIFIPIGS